MNSALLRNPIEILQLNTVSSASGHNKATYEHKYNTKAHITFNSENQIVSEGEVFYPTTRTFIVRAYVPVVETDRIRWDNKDWKIISINKNIYFNDIEIVTALVNK